MPIDWTRLAAPFPAHDVEWKPGATTRDKKKGLAMAYITARAVQDRLDEVFGPGGWKNEFREGPSGGVICRIWFTNDDGEWVWREDGADNTDVEAVKGGLSNAMKRAGAALGIGRYLY
ncbi:MAG: Rad52/Rad22 family DNA repair protein, partial [Bacteroidota bacterium]